MSLCLCQSQGRQGWIYCEANMLKVSMLVNVCDHEYHHIRAPDKSPGRREEETIIHFHRVLGSVLGTFYKHPFISLYEDIYKEFILYLSARLLLSTCLVHFMDTVKLHR